MKTTAKGVAGASLVGGAALAGIVIWGRRRRARARGENGRWHVLTVNRAQSDLIDGQRPEPLAELGDEIDVLYRAAPGGRGTEVAVRWSESAGAGSDGHVEGAIPKALREAKQVWETGEVLRPDRPGTTRRTLLNRPLEYATTHGREAGRL